MIKNDLTTGKITKKLLLFAGPMILGNLFLQIYNIADTLIVGRYLGTDALAAVGSTYTLTTFLYSVLIGLCMGCGTLVSYYHGEHNLMKVKKSVHIAFVMIGLGVIVMEMLLFLFFDPILQILRIPQDIYQMTGDYVRIIFVGILFVALYNFYAYLLRAIGNSAIPLYFLGASSVLNIVLDIWLVAYVHTGIKGAAYATVISQILSGIGLSLYVYIKAPRFRIHFREMIVKKEDVLEVLHQSLAASVQQSVMNFGILMIQGLVNSFGTTVMAAFTVAVKIDTLAYMPAQEFGNAFSLFISQNFGAKKWDRVKEGIKNAVRMTMIFCISISILVVCFAGNLMQIFVSADEVEIIKIGIGYLRIEGAFYAAIGILFLFYGYFRGIQKPEISLLLTIVSLGTRVALAYLLAPMTSIGVIGIWVAIPIGWILADSVGAWKMKQ